MGETSRSRIARAFARDGGTNARKGEPRKIRERAFIYMYTCVENLGEVSERVAVATSGKQGGHRGTNTIKDAVARTTRTKSVSVEREGKMKRGRTTKIKENEDSAAWD